MTFALTSPDEYGPRFQDFRDLVQAFYRWRWDQECPWDASDASQLSRVIKACPRLDIGTMKRWLYNYGCSDDIKPGERPRSFLPRIHNYSVVPLDRFGRSQDAEIPTKEAQRTRRSNAAFDRVRARLYPTE